MIRISCPGSHVLHGLCGNVLVIVVCHLSDRLDAKDVVGKVVHDPHHRFLLASHIMTHILVGTPQSVAIRAANHWPAFSEAESSALLPIQLPGLTAHSRSSRRLIGCDRQRIGSATVQLAAPADVAGAGARVGSDPVAEARIRAGCSAVLAAGRLPEDAHVPVLRHLSEPVQRVSRWRRDRRHGKNPFLHPKRRGNTMSPRASVRDRCLTDGDCTDC